MSIKDTFKSYSLDVLVNRETGTVTLSFNNSIMNSIAVSVLPELLETLASTKPYISRGKKLTYRSGAMPLVEGKPYVVDIHDNSKIRRATNNDLTIALTSRLDGSPLGSWIDESGKKVCIKYL
jgi:hypothetical protein